MPSAFGKEQVSFFEIDQPFCVKTYGQTTSAGTCSAVLGTTGQHKCYNARATCQSPADYSATGSVVTLRFCMPQEGVIKFGPVIPMLDKISTTPLSLNIGGMDRNSGALGQREVVTAKMSEGRYSDHLVDKYRAERLTGAASSPSAPFDPYTTGTFWAKWLARNPYYNTYRCRVRVGTLDQALSAMTVRNYLLYSVASSPEDGQVTVLAKDLFSRIEQQKAVAPKASKGALSADLTGTPATFTLTPSGIGNTDYAASGWVAIQDEIIQYTRAADVCTVVARAQFNTAQVDHKQEDLVQQVLVYTSQKAQDIAYDLLTVYGSMAATDLNKAQWDINMAAISTLYTGRVAEPTPVLDLVGELSEQAGFTAWPDPVTNKVEMTALRASDPIAVLDDRALVAKSLSMKRIESQRASQVWVYYAMINPKAQLDDRKNYRSRLVSVDLGSEGADKYGTPSIRTVFSRWIPQFGRTSAKECADRLLTNFVDPPVEAKFRLHYAKEGSLQLSRFFTLSVADIQGFTGAPDVVTLAATELERDENEIGVKAQSIFLTPAVPTNERVIFIEVNAYNVNLRDVYDSQYAAPAGTEVVRFKVISGVKVGSLSTGSPSVRTGTWPAGVSLRLDVESGGRVEGRAGGGGAGGAYNANGSAGAAGGDALLIEYALTVDNQGQLWAGAGGGGGGGGLTEAFGKWAGGGGGGGGTGYDAGAGAAGGQSPATPSYDGAPGSAGGTEGPGGGGLGSATPTGSRRAGNGGAGGAAGSAGVTGEDAQSDVWTFKGAGGAGGAAGKYVNGNSLVTWVTTGDRRGNVS